MRSFFFVVILLTPLAGGNAVAQDWAKRMFKDSRHDFGTLAKGAKAEFEFPFTNPYVEDVRITSVVASCGCTSVRVKNNQRLVKTHQKGTIVASINSSTFVGSKGATITVRFDKPYRAEVQLQVKAYVRNDVVLRPGSAQLGSVAQGTAAERRINIAISAAQNLRILDARSPNPHLAATIVETGRNGRQTDYQLRIHLDEKAPAGYIRDHLILVTNNRRNSQIPVLVEGYVRSAISISPHSLFMGVVKPGEKIKKQLVVQADEPFVIKRISTSAAGFDFDTSAEKTPKRLHVIPVTFVAGDELGKVIQAIQIETDHQNLKGELLAQVTVVGLDGKVPETSTPDILRPDPAAVAMPSPQHVPPPLNPPRLVRPDLDDDLPERPILSRFPRLQRLVEEREAAAQDRELGLQPGTPTPAYGRRGEPDSPPFRTEAQQRRYENLLRRNGPSPATDRNRLPR